MVLGTSTLEADRGTVNGRLWAELWMTLVLLVIATGLIAHSGADLAISALFFRDGGWPIGDQFPWKLLYRIDRTPAILLVMVCLGGALRSVWTPALRQWRRTALFMLLALVIGPGLLVNAVLKDHWGRPRPREVAVFGGTKSFHQPWQPGVSGQGRSFPSGHASAAFFLCTPYFVYRRRRPALASAWLAGGILFGLAMSAARIIQGGHFLSDTLWAFGLVWLSSLLLAALLLRDTGRLQEPPQ